MVGADSLRLGGFEEQIRVLQEESRRTMELLREKIKQNVVVTKNSIMEVFWSLLTEIMNDEGKGVVNEESVTNGIWVLWEEEFYPYPERLNHKQGLGSGSRNSVGGAVWVFSWSWSYGKISS